MRKTLTYLIFALAFLMTSCKRELHESLIICIQNNTTEDISAVLYSKSDSSCRHILLEVSNPNYTYSRYKEIGVSEDLNVDPHILMTEIYDSIFITLKDSAVLKFTPKNAIGYSENIFTENSTWYYRLSKDRNCGNGPFTCQPLEYHQYLFVISEDKIITE